MLFKLGLRSWLADFGGDLTRSLGPDGVETSSGQAQRLSIARALLRQPKLLILDEVTSNLDTNAETKVLQLLDELLGNVTVILVTHSENMMKLAGNVISLDVPE